MFWNKKEKETGLPDLPPAQVGRVTLPPVDVSTDYTIRLPKAEVNTLPSFTEYQKQKGYNQQTIKEAISPTETLPEPPPLRESVPGPNRVIEMDEWKPSKMPGMQQSINSAVSPVPRSESLPKKIRDEEPIFVRLDKFQSARRSLENIQTKINEIDDILKNIKEVRIKENAELDYWEKEMQAVKARVRSVTDEIFERVE